jgi:hypothetical protein
MLYLQPCFLLFLVLRIVSHLSFPILPTFCDFSLNLAAFFTTTLVCHGELAKDRPSARHLTEFYLWMSFGGVLGGMFNALFAPVALPYGLIAAEYGLAMVVSCMVRPYLTQDVSEARYLGIPRKIAEAPAMLADSVLFVFGMTTYNAANTMNEPQPSGFSTAFVRFLRRCCPSSNLLEIILDFTVPIAFGYFAYVMLDIGNNEQQYFGITFRRSYTMAVVVVLALAMAMRPVRFGLSVGALLLVVTLYDRDARIFEDRGFFGPVRVREAIITVKDATGQEHEVPAMRTLIHGGIDHGRQLLWPPGKRREPVTYFHPTNGIGELFHKLTWGNPPGKVGSPEHKEWMEQNYWTDAPKKGQGESQGDWAQRHQEWLEAFVAARARFYPADARMPASLVGLAAVSPWALVTGTQQQPPYAVIGLGAGTLAAHGQPFQWVDYYEIDPIIRRLSVPPPGGDEDDLIFYYVNDALKRGAKLDIKMGDGRLRLNEAPDRYYHAMLLDAFSSDAVPVHLLTREAVELYMDKLADGGVLIFNTTNRYVDLPPVLARIAEELNLECLYCPDYRAMNLPNGEHYTIPEKYGADWVALRRRGNFANGGPSLFDRLQVTEDRWRRQDPHPGRPWTDAYSNLLSVMRW